MTNLWRLFAAVSLAATLAACGGGGGSNPPAGGAGGTGGTGGTAGTGSTGGTGTTVAPTLALSVVDASGAAVAGNAVTPGSTVFAQAQVKDAAGTGVANKLVAFTSKNSVIAFTPSSGQVLTDATGTAKVQLAAASLGAASADTITASALVGTAAVSNSLDVQTSAANVSLSNFSATTGSLTAFQSTAVGVDVAVNGAPATTTPVSVSFAASCGSFSPVSARSNSGGRAVSTFLATGCSGGTATLTASAISASAVQTTVSVLPPTPTNLQFVSATPSIIYTSVAGTGLKQSAVVFKVVDAQGTPITAPTNVQVSLSPSAINSGVTFAATGTTATQVLSTDSQGLVSVSVASGSVPTPVALTAQLVSNPSVTASSAGLSVNSGRPNQKFFSLSVGAHNIEGWSHDGITTKVTASVADRLGQPVPDGTPVTFVSEGAQIGGSCLVAANSNGITTCSVTFSSQAYRPGDGRITVLAYAEGEEEFTDVNGNNTYDAGEPFNDLGQPFIDANESGAYESGEQVIGVAGQGSGIGTTACSAPTSFGGTSVTNTCDGVWGATRVRQQQVIVLSTSSAGPLQNKVFSSTGFSFLLADLNGNAMPYGSTVAAAVTATPGSTCTVQQVIPASVPDSTDPTAHTVVLSGGCSGQTVNVTVTSPIGTGTLLPVLVP